ncbi:uncharacterized protein ASCRUDRAFT_124308 [Ascoidea rubescens DSM 1968]|uniref:Transmembrane protein n=1 Tax=Ascoidea rubescens DSM 1968 TaxID=1344418 RepID=A0A1D2VMJ0_9ASCO|nr:hypothetical protein ASCRUDRAFT_124308 [Ascoidea rubescens DSM 1968]ODV62822.1 hypothetical protein ASCRUDRAFT_124308 [Ascoidea rubescens DSM 1968]
MFHYLLPSKNQFCQQQQLHLLLLVVLPIILSLLIMTKITQPQCLSVDSSNTITNESDKCSDISSDDEERDGDNLNKFHSTRSVACIDENVGA